MKRGRTALTRGQHFSRALNSLGISKKAYKRMKPHPGAYIEQLFAVDRLAFGGSPNPKVSVLLVPEQRKRRSERDPALLAEQIKNASNRLAGIKAGTISGNTG